MKSSVVLISILAVAGLVPGGFAVPVLPPAEAPSVSATEDGRSTAAVKTITVVDRGEGVDVEIRGSGRLVPRASVLTGPDRLIVDFPGADYLVRQPNIAVNRRGVLSVRTSLFRADPPLTRVVVDLSAAAPYQMATSDGKVIVHMGAAAPATASPPLRAKAARSRDPATPMRAKPARSGEPGQAERTSTAAPAPPARSAIADNSQNVIQAVEIARARHAIAVEVTGTRPVTPHVTRLPQPERLVVDLPDTVPGNARRRVSVNAGGIEDVRLALHQANPPITRLVVDVDGPRRQFHVRSAGNKIVLQSDGRQSQPVPAAQPPASSAAHHAPAPPPVLEKAPNVPPRVTLEQGLLRIDAENSILTDVLAAIGARTGADIQLPPGMGSERVAVKLGPAPPAQAVASLLAGSGFDYIIVPSPSGANLKSIILTPKGGATTPPPTPSAPPPGSDEEADAENQPDDGEPAGGVAGPVAEPIPEPARQPGSQLGSQGTTAPAQPGSETAPGAKNRSGHHVTKPPLEEPVAPNR